MNAMGNGPRHWLRFFALVGAIAVAGTTQAADRRVLVDAHIHYSHDAVEQLPPTQAIEVLRQAGLKRAMVSSSDDRGTQALYALAPDLIVPVLRPYRRRGETGTWLNDPTVPKMLAELLAKNFYAGIGEFHVFGADADKPVMREVVALGLQHGVFLHAHADAHAVEHLFAQAPDAVILWAHSGFDDPVAVGEMLAKYDNLWADLAFRSEHASDGQVDPQWLALFEAYPDRFMVGTDTYTPERWHFVVDHANWNRAWLKTLPPALADAIAFGNAEALLTKVGKLKASQ